MNLSRIIKNPLFIGTILLTASGVLSRIIGFFYRIFLSHTIGAEGVGIYQLIFPVYILCFALTSAGIQSAISKYVAEASVSKNNISGKCYMVAGFLLSFSLSILCAFYLHNHADFLATRIVHESRTAPLFRILAYAIPCCSIHNCIMGYYYGIKKAAIPSVAQLLEQIVRVLSVYVIYRIQLQDGIEISPSIAVWGVVCGEASSSLFTMAAIRISKFPLNSLFSACKKIFCLSLPMTGNRVVLSLFTSMEAILIPLKLQESGLSTSQALSLFGILTGMVLPLILFPSSITNSLAVMLLPTVSEASAAGKEEKIRTAVSKSITYCMLFGFFCTVFFFVTGSFLGNFLFHTDLCGEYIRQLSFICPFMYLASTLVSILNGLGKTLQTFCYNLIGISIRLLFAVFAIPLLGTKGYLWGLLASEIILCTCLVWALKSYLPKNKG